MTRDRYLERQVEKLTNLNSELSARIVGLEARVEVYREKKLMLENDLAKAWEERRVLRELVDGVTETVEICTDTCPAQIAWKEDWLRKAREIFQLHRKEREDK